MENRSIAQLLGETADLLEISSGDPFRIRSYRRAAEAVEQSSIPLSTLINEPGRLLAIPGIGKGMVANIQELVSHGSMKLRDELLSRYRPTMLDMLRLPGMGPKTVALLWEALGVGSIDELAAAIDEGRLVGLPRFGDKQIAKLKKGIEDHKRNSGRYHMDDATLAAERIILYLKGFPGIDTVTPAGSLRRGRETVGDLDLLATGPACEPDVVAAAVAYPAAYPPIASLIAKGQNKVSFNLREGMQVDVRLLPHSSYGAALQYFTGSKMHNLSIRQRALRLGYTLSEYALARLDDGSSVAASSEEEVYSALGLDWIAPELRENTGEIEAAAEHALPSLVDVTHIRGDVHTHTDASDGKNTIREMAEAAISHGYEYIAITDHSRNLSMINGLDDERALAHMERIHLVEQEMEGRIRIFSGIEVDILGDGTLDLSDEVLSRLDIVIASVHSLFNQPEKEMTARILLAIENPYVRILGHPTGRMLLRREGYALDLNTVCRRAAELRVAIEHNANPNRLDLCDRDLRMAKHCGCKFVVNTDAHSLTDFDKMPYGIRQLRRAWLSPSDILNTRPAKDFITSLRPRP